MLTKLSRVLLIGALFLGALCLPASVSAQERSPIVDQIAKTYGVDSWGQVEATRFTFNLDPRTCLDHFGFSFLRETTRATVRSLHRNRATSVRHTNQLEGIA